MSAALPPQPHDQHEHGGPSVGGQTRRLGLAGPRGAVRLCRDFTRDALRDWGWFSFDDEEVHWAIEDVLLLVSELVTNACLHGGTPREFVLRSTAKALRVEVTDANTIEPVPRSPYAPGRPGGHGLRIIARLAKDWGTERRASDKTVWLEVRVPLRLRLADGGRAGGRSPGAAGSAGSRRLGRMDARLDGRPGEQRS
jgi:hypothetical protein